MANQFKPSDFSTNLKQPRPIAVSSIQPSGQSIGACVVVVLELPEAVVVVVELSCRVELSAGLGSRCLGVAAVDVVEVDEVVVVIVVVVVGGGDVVVVVVVVVGGGGVVVVVVVVNVVVLQARANGRTRRRSRMLSLQF